MYDIEKLRIMKTDLELIASKIDCLKPDIDEITDCIKSKRNLSEETSGRVITALKDINEINDSFKTMLKEFDVKEELSDNLAEIDLAVTKAIEEYELDNKLTAYKTFLRLYSEDCKIMELLNIRKKELEALLNAYDSEHDEELAPYGNFVEAINETDPAKLATYVAELTPKFGGELVGAAIFAKSIKISDEVVSPDVVDLSQHETNDLTTDQDIKPIAIIADNKVIDEEPDNGNSGDDNALSSNQVSIIEDLFPNGFSELFDEYAEKKRVGTKIFINDMKQRNIPSNVTVMSAVDTFGAVNAEMIATSTSAPFSLITDSIQYLCKKGYLREYSVSGFGEFYCASPKGIRALHAKDARGFLKLKGAPSSTEKELSAVTINSVLTRLALTKMATALYAKGSTEYAIYRHEVNDDYFVTVMRNAETKTRLVIYGYYSEKSDELEEFITQANECMDDKNHYYIIAGANDELARSTVDSLINRLSLEPDAIYYYSLLDGELKRYSDDETVSFSIFADSFADDEKNDLSSNEIADNKTIVVDENTDSGSETDFVVDEPKPVETTEEYAIQEVAKVETQDEVLVKDDTDEVYANMFQMITNGKTYCATTYIRALSDGSDEFKALYEQLAYAVNAPWMKCSYSSHKMFQLYTVNQNTFSDYMLAAASLRNFFMNHTCYDYEMKQLQDYIKKSERISSDSALMNAMYKMALFKDEINKGMDCYADYRIKDRVEINKRVDELKHEAKSFFDLYINNQPKNHKGVKRFIETWKRVFSSNGDLASSLRMVIDNDTDCISLTKEILSNNFISNDCTVDYSNIDMNKLNSYIDDNWNSTYGATGSQYKTSNLMSDLRNNLTNAIEKVLKVICDWIVIVEVNSDGGKDAGFERYLESKSDLTEELKRSIMYMDSLRPGNDEEMAGIAIMKETVSEILSRLDGSYSENEHKYYYIDFLRGNSVWLDESYMPDMHGRIVDLPELSLPNRILAHSKSALMSFDDKLDYIFNERGDDYGSAELIINYLKETRSDSDFSQYDIASSLDYAKQEAKLKLDGFIENLELAQSYGQIEESKENIKEKISSIAHDCYQYAVDSNNYSFLTSVLNGYTKKIREDAKVRGKALSEELAKIKAIEPKTDLKDQKIAQIEEMIDEQNYTVAEDLLSRINDDEIIDNYEVSRVDYLKKFIDEYDYNYKIVTDSSKKMSVLVSSKIRNKDEKGARRLVDNWMANGQNIGTTKLLSLLDALGFTNISIKEQPKINGKIENYVVTIKHPIGVKPNYKHPIAAFGSKASESGFRVVCLFGRFSADGLIEEFKNISGGKNTIILLDYALSLSERRRLARKTKSDMGDKVFAVLDRVLLMFLVNNYNSQFVNQIMMSTMIPFSYCQPYVWDSSKIMPPEIFVGRKDELEKIESPQGVNIVYGGRQLGKSALLKMAKMDIDYSESYNRAVYIEIKGLDYKKAAKKIGHELYDSGILKEDIETEDWDDLSRCIKRRLMDNKNEKISYLLLLLDEADTFIESCESVAFHPLDTLKDIQSVGADRFKFVIAGLHNIVRFKRDAALSNNSVLTHLSSITIKPFSPLEARQLLKEPLYYLGLRFPNDRDISLILANTNYFPGLIQLYCANLVDAMRKDDYAGYNEGDTPAYDVTTKHFKKVLSDQGFTDQVREKFEITLKLDEDNMYYILALIVAYLYHQDSLSANCAGVTAEDVISAAKELSITKVASQNKAAIEGFMQELKELNIFRQTIDNLYLFSRYSFFQMMGTIDEVENKLMDYMEG